MACSQEQILRGSQKNAGLGPGYISSPVDSKVYSKDSEGDYAALKSRNGDLSSELNQKNVEISNLRIELDKMQFKF